MTSLVIGTLWWWWEGRGIKKSFFPLFLTHTRAQLWTIKKKTPEVVWEKQCHLLMLYLSPKECSDLPLKLLQLLVETVLFTGQLWRTLRTHHATTFVVQSPSRVWLFATPWTAARQASLSLTISQNLSKYMFTELVMPSSHLTLWCSLLLLPSIFSSIRDFSNESAFRIRWPKYWSFSISPSSEYLGLISLKTDWLDLLAVQGTFRSLLQHYSSKASIIWCSAFFTVQLSQL